MANKKKPERLPQFPDIGDLAKINPSDLKDRILFYNGLKAAFLAAWHATDDAGWEYCHSAAQYRADLAAKALREQQEQERQVRYRRDLRKLKRAIDQELKNPGDLKRWSEVLFYAESGRILDQTPRKDPVL